MQQIHIGSAFKHRLTSKFKDSNQKEVTQSELIFRNHKS